MKELEKRDRIWQGPFIERRRSEIRSAVENTSPSLIPAKTRRLKEASSFGDLLDAYLYAVESSSADLLAPHAAKPLLELAGEVLEELAIKPRRSKLDYLYRDLYREKSRMFRRDRDPWAGHWLECLAESDETSFPAAPPMAYPRREEMPFDAAAPLPDQIDQLTAMRWSGRAEEALFLLDTLLVPDNIPADLESKLYWLRLSVAMQLNPDESTLRAAEKTAKQKSDGRKLLEAHLWALASANKLAIGCLGALPSGEGPLYVCVRTIEDGYRHSGLALQSRVERVGLCLSPLLGQASDQYSALCLAAAGRWLARNRRGALSRECLRQYRELSARRSGGTTPDIFGLFREEGNPPLRHLPTLQAERWTEVGKLGATLCRVAGKFIVSSPFRSKARRANEMAQLLDTFSEVAYRHTDPMKGAWMKLGQLAGYLGPDLPADARRRLGDLQQSSTPIASDIVEETISMELGKTVHELFSYWNPHPLATGSVGQVHRARTRAGDEVVVKVQYPEIESILKRDIQSLSLLIPLIRPFFRHWDFTSLLEETRSHFLAECDYLAEAENQREFCEIFAGDEQVVIAKVYSELSSPRVLTSEYLSGSRFREFSELASSAERNLAAEIMTRWHWTSIFKAKTFSADPHPGNFLFLPGRVAFVDFGNVKRWSGDACDGIRAVMDGLLHDDYPRFASGYALAQMADANDKVIREEYEKIRQHVLGFLRDDRRIEFNATQAIEYFRVCTTANPNTRHTVKINRESALLFKAHWSFFATVGQLRPCINWRRTYLQSIS